MCKEAIIPSVPLLAGDIKMNWMSQDDSQNWWFKLSTYYLPSTSSAPFRATVRLNKFSSTVLCCWRVCYVTQLFNHLLYFWLFSVVLSLLFAKSKLTLVQRNNFFQSDPKRLKKELPKFIKTIKAEDRILLIGASRAPFEADLKPFTGLYQKIVLIPRPDYASRHRELTHFNAWL